MQADIDVRTMVAATWAQRHGAECAASQRYARLARELRFQRAPSELVVRAETASEDEARHAELCLTLAKRYGWEGDAVEMSADECKAPSQFDEHDSLLYELVGFCCLSETLNAALLLAILEQATVPRIRDVVRSLLADEVKHGQLGWGMLQWSLECGRGAFLADELVGMLQSIGLANLYVGSTETKWSDELTNHGELSTAMRQEIFLAAMNSVVFAGFEQAGISTASTRSWLAAYEPRFGEYQEPS